MTPLGVEDIKWGDAETIPGDAKRSTEIEGIADDELFDAVDVAQRGRAIAASGIRYLVDGIIPDYGIL